MNALKFVFSAAITTLLASCGEPPADLSKKETYSSNGLTFQYPGNWEVTEDETVLEFRYIFVETPGDALVILQSYPKDLSEDLEAFAKDFSATAAEETPMADVITRSMEAKPEADGFQWMMEKVDITLLGETIPHVRYYATKPIGDRQIYLIQQVSTEDLNKVKQGFELVQKTLKGTAEAP